MNPLGSCMLLLLLFAASRGMTLTSEEGASWQKHKAASMEILQELWKLGRFTFQAIQVQNTIQLPERIECQDNCDPDSLAQDKMPCLKKIHRELNHYRKLLIEFPSPRSTTKIQNTLTKLLHLLSEDEGHIESIKSSASQGTWAEEPIQALILWRLQSFATLVARVFSHCAALNDV